MKHHALAATIGLSIALLTSFVAADVAPSPKKKKGCTMAEGHASGGDSLAALLALAAVATLRRRR